MTVFEDLLRRLRYDVTGFANVLTTLLASRIWQGALVTGTVPAGGTSVTVQHGLQRVPSGAIPVAIGAGGYLGLSVDAPTNTTTITVRAGVAPVADQTFTLWVF